MEDLNEKQLEAVKQIDGPVLILAGPGAGKTKTMIERTAYILNQDGVLPENILLSTFTDKASNELISR
ncbi:UvrD-helicase domain-containing protein, partial [Fusobacterium sp.]